MSAKQFLFSYGTLQFEKVQIETYGRLLKGHQDFLSGYCLEQLEVKDPAVLKKSGRKYHPIAVKTGKLSDQVNGMIYEITDLELSHTDAYEVSDYRRVLENFDSGKKAWIYIKRDNYSAK